MKVLTLAAMAASALVALTAPGLGVAQPYDRGPGWDHRGPGWDHGPGGPDRPGYWDIDRRIDWLQRRIDRGRDDGSLERDEAWRVQGRLDEIRHDLRRLRRHNDGHLRGDDREMLNNRLDRLNDRIRWLRHNDERRPW